VMRGSTGGLGLTDVGENSLERTRAILNEIEEAEALASASTADPRGHLRVLVPPGFAVHQLAKHLPRFRGLYPRVTIELSVPGPVETVDENFDVSILMVGSRPLDGNFVARRLANSEIVTCASPEYLARCGRPLHPRDLLDHEALLPAVPSARRELTFRAAGDPTQAVTIEPQRAAALSTIHADTLYAAALAGMGIAGLPSFVAEDALVEHALERVLPHWRLLTLTIYAAMPTRKHVPARTRAFVDFLVEAFGGEERDPWLAAAGCPTCPEAQAEEAARAALERVAG